jgi:hypothetical protein
VAHSPVQFPHEHRPVAGVGLAVVASAWAAAVGAAVFAAGAWRVHGLVSVDGEDALLDMGFVTALAVLGGPALFLIALLAASGGFAGWYGRVRWNALLATGPGWPVRSGKWTLTDVWTASDSWLRHVAPVDRPTNAVFYLWRRAPSAVVAPAAGIIVAGNGPTITSAVRHTAYLAALQVLVTIFFAVLTTVAVRAITRRQTDPATFVTRAQL